MFPFLAPNQKNAHRDDQAPAHQKRCNDPRGKQKSGRAVAPGDWRDGDKKAQAKQHSTSVNSYRLSAHYLFVFTFATIASKAAFGGHCKITIHEA
jgi:hypothetical protein